MSDIVNMMGDTVTGREKSFPFMTLPYELRKKIYRFAAIKPDGYIGQANTDGVECAIGAQAPELMTAYSLAGLDNDLHFPSNCRHPSHEKEQLFQDFRLYRCVNLALTCREFYAETTAVFFKENGFELCDANDMMQFLFLIGSYRANLIRKLRLLYDINLNVDYFENILQKRRVSGKIFYQNLELQYLTDDVPNSTFVNVLKLIKTFQSLKGFELVYRLKVPGNIFDPIKDGNVGYISNYNRLWFGESFQVDVHTENVLEKLRQDNGKLTHNVVDVLLASVTANDLAEHVNTIVAGKNFLRFLSGILVGACVAHAESCIEYAGVDTYIDYVGGEQKRIMGCPSQESWFGQL
jgi:hypothetical protein